MLRDSLFRSVYRATMKNRVASFTQRSLLFKYQANAVNNARETSSVTAEFFDNKYYVAVSRNATKASGFLRALFALCTKVYSSRNMYVGGGGGELFD